MVESATTTGGQRSLWALACIVVIVAGLRAAAVILVPLALALFIAILSLPLLAFLRRHGVPVMVAVAATMLCDFAFLSLGLLLAMGSLGEVTENAPRYAAAMHEKLGYTVEWWTQKGVPINDWLPNLTLGPQAVMGVLGSTLLKVGNLLSQGLLVLLTMFFLLLGALELPARLTAASSGWLNRPLLERLVLEVRRYLAIKTLIAAALGLLAAAWAYLMGLDFVLALGLLAFACHFIPNVGALLAALPAMALAFVAFDLPRALLVGLGYTALGLVLGNLVEPVLMGRRLRLSSLVVFVSLIFWGWVWGPVGMLLSVPLTMSLKILSEHSDGFGWVATLLDSEVPSLPGEVTVGLEPSATRQARDTPLAEPVDEVVTR